jgi:hypothetical protein
MMLVLRPSSNGNFLDIYSDVLEAGILEPACDFWSDVSIDPTPCASFAKAKQSAG